MLQESHRLSKPTTWMHRTSMGILLSQIPNEEIQAKRRTTTGTTLLILKFEQLTMTAVKTVLEFLDRITDCIAEIKACDPFQLPTEEQTAIRAKAGIEFAFPHLYAALQVAQ